MSFLSSTGQSSDFAYASASVSLPNKKSTKGRAWDRVALKGGTYKQCGSIGAGFMSLSGEIGRTIGLPFLLVLKMRFLLSISGILMGRKHKARSGTALRTLRPARFQTTILIE